MVQKRNGNMVIGSKYYVWTNAFELLFISLSDQSVRMQIPSKLRLKWLQTIDNIDEQGTKQETQIRYKQKNPPKKKKQNKIIDQKVVDFNEISLLLKRHFQFSSSVEKRSFLVHYYAFPAISLDSLCLKFWLFVDVVLRYLNTMATTIFGCFFFCFWRTIVLMTLCC